MAGRKEHDLDRLLSVVRPEPDAPDAYFVEAYRDLRRLAEFVIRICNGVAMSSDGLMAETSPVGITLADDDGLRGRIPEQHGCLAFHPDGRHLAAGSPSGVIEIWDVETWTKVGELVGHQGTVYGVDYSPDGTRLVSGGNDTTVRLWDVASGEEVLELRGHKQYVKAVAFSPDGSRIASASGDTTVRIWEAAEPAD